MVGVTTYKPVATDGVLYYVSGGAGAPTSGTMSDPSLSGPWMVEHQDLTVDYVRVPWGTVSATTCTLNEMSMSHRVAATRLALAVRANYSKRKIYGSYNASSFQQSQKFQINAVSADHKGNTYGDLSAIGGASGGTAMGPAGTIITYQPWMQRRAWDDSIDTEINRAADGYLFFVRRNSCDGLKHLGSVNSEFMTDFEGHAVYPGAPGSFLQGQYLTQDSDAHLQVYGSHYSLPGAYSTDKETTAEIFTLIDQLGTIVVNSDLMAEPTTDGNGVPGFGEGFAEYNISRHDYTT